MTLEEYLSSFRGKTVAVLGYGVSNRPLVRLLAEAGLDATVRDKGSLPEIPGVRCISGEGYLEELTEDVIFRTPGLRPDRIPRKPGAVVTSEMEAFFALCPCPILAVTGSDGKTTTTTLIAELLKASGRRVWLGGNIGHPLLAEVPEMDPEADRHHIAIRQENGKVLTRNVPLDYFGDLQTEYEARNGDYIERRKGGDGR